MTWAAQWWRRKQRDMRLLLLLAADVLQMCKCVKKERQKSTTAARLSRREDGGLLAEVHQTQKQNTSRYLVFSTSSCLGCSIGVTSAERRGRDKYSRRRFSWSAPTGRPLNRASFARAGAGAVFAIPVVAFANRFFDTLDLGTKSRPFLCRSPDRLGRRPARERCKATTFCGLVELRRVRVHGWVEGRGRSSMM